MKIKVIKEIEAKWLQVQIPIRYEDDQEELRKIGVLGENERSISFEVNVDTGELNWVSWNCDVIKKWSFRTKVCDTGTYALLDDNYNVIKKIQDYVPAIIPNDYGDYINLNFDGGKYVDFPAYKTLEEFQDEQLRE